MPTGWAGLKFKDLTAKCIPQKNPSKGVLAVDDCGNVIYVPNENGNNAGVNAANNGLSLDPNNPNIVQLGQDFGAAGNPANLLNNREVPLNDFNINFTSLIPSTIADLSKNNIKIGATTVGGFNYGARLWVEKEAPISGGGQTVGGYFKASRMTPTASNTDLFGLVSEAYADPSTGGQLIVGHRTLGDGITGIGGTYGILAEAKNGQSNFAGDFKASNINASNYGIYSVANAGTTNFGIYAKAAGPVGSINYAGFFDGDIYGNGISFTAGNVIMSDERIKKNIIPIENAMNVIKQIKAKAYNYDTQNPFGMNFTNQEQYGFIAQELEQVLPNLVLTNKKPEVKDATGKIVSQKIDYKAINYIEIIPFLVKGMQEQQEILEKQYSIIEQLQVQMNELRNEKSGGLKIIQKDERTSVNLSSNQTVVLEQNVPNPFAEHTVINYQLPEDANKAQLLFYDTKGRLIQTTNLKTKENGAVDVFASNLSSGVYTYSLVIDDKIYETKKMIKE